MKTRLIIKIYLLCLLFLFSISTGTSFGKISDPKGLVDIVNTKKTFSDFKQFNAKKWPGTTGGYVWSPLQKSGESGKKEIKSTGIFFKKSAYKLYLTQITGNPLHRKYRPTYEAIWAAYPTMKPTIEMVSSHKGGKARERATGNSRYSLTAEIYSFSGKSALAGVYTSGFNYSGFFPKSGKPVTTPEGNKISLYMDKGNRQCWFTTGSYAISLRPMSRMYKGDGIPEDVYRLAADGFFSAVSGSPVKPPEPSPDTGPFIFDMFCEASGYMSSELAVSANGFPETIDVSGVVRNDQNLPLAGAMIRIDEYGVMATTDKKGRYNLPVTFVDGKGRVSIKQDFRLNTNPEELSVSISFENQTVPRANGKSVPATISVSNGGIPWANKQMSLIPPSQFTVHEIPVWYIKKPFPAGLNTTIKTDKFGKAEVEFPVPLVKKFLLEQTPNNNPVDSLFPIIGDFSVEDGVSGKKAVTTIHYASPFPRITKLVTPALWADKWPSSRGQLHLSEPGCDVQMKGYGRFRVDTYEKDRHVKVWMKNRKKLFFGFMPVVPGADDFTDIPDYGKELGKALSQTALELVVSEVGDKALNSYGTSGISSDTAVKRIQEATASKAAWAKSLQTAAANGKFSASHAALVSDAAGKMASRATTFLSGASASAKLTKDLGSAALELKKAELTLQSIAEGKPVSSEDLTAQKNAVTLGSTAYGLFETAAGFTKWGAKALDKSSNSMAVLKLAFTAAQTTHDCYIEYQKTALGWEAMMLTPVVVEISNPEGFTIRSTRLAPVRFEKKMK